ncbi:MAG: tricorn protease-like protein [Limisphaerales bacterium]|jgi:tricorn protease-like protein
MQFKCFFLLVALSIIFNGQVNAQPGQSDIVLLDIVWGEDGRPTLSNPVWVTNREGYDNQPSFDPKGEFLLYTAIIGEQADIYRYNIEEQSTVQLTKTETSEYSPKIMPDGDFFSVVMVESDDSTQRLWKYPISGGKPRIIMDAIDPVGYYSWLDGTNIALFILGKERNVMVMSHRRKQNLRVISSDIGRCLQTIPSESSISFVANGTDQKLIRRYDHLSKRVSDICKTLPESEDYCWSPDGKILMGSGSRLYYFDERGDGRWHLGFELNELGITKFNRISVNRTGDKLAIVSVP